LLGERAADPPALKVVAHDHRNRGHARLTGGGQEFGHADDLVVVRLR